MAEFEEVLQEERKHLWGQDHTVIEPEGVGLAFSGGGMRSAAFNLGILQGLAQAKLLDKIDNLSTVSGGGYVSAGVRFGHFLRARYNTRRSGTSKQVRERKLFEPMTNL
jgi:predicted acylesterase/phospholipase RssA